MFSHQWLVIVVGFFIGNFISLLAQGDDTMTGDGGEYLRAEDLRELGDDSLPGQYLDGMNYLRFSLEGGRTDRCIILCQSY